MAGKMRVWAVAALCSFALCALAQQTQTPNAVQQMEGIWKSLHKKAQPSGTGTQGGAASTAGGSGSATQVSYASAAYGAKDLPKIWGDLNQRPDDAIKSYNGQIFSGTGVVGIFKEYDAEPYMTVGFGSAGEVTCNLAKGPNEFDGIKGGMLVTVTGPLALGHTMTIHTIGIGSGRQPCVWTAAANAGGRSADLTVSFDDVQTDSLSGNPIRMKEKYYGKTVRVTGGVIGSIDETFLTVHGSLAVNQIICHLRSGAGGIGNLNRGQLIQVIGTMRASNGRPDQLAFAALDDCTFE